METVSGGKSTIWATKLWNFKGVRRSAFSILHGHGLLDAGGLSMGTFPQLRSLAHIVVSVFASQLFHTLCGPRGMKCIILGDTI